MTAMTSGPAFRLARAAIFAAVCVLTTALGHALMSADTLPGWAVGYAFGNVTAGAWWLTGRERGALVTTGSTVGTQLTLHALFSLSQSLVTHAPAPTAADGMAGMSMDSGHMGLTSAGHGWSAGMLLAHTLAALLCGLWLWRGEAAAFQLGRSLAAFVFAPLRLAWRMLVFAGTKTPPVRPRTALGPAQRLRGALLRYAVSRRGPPGRPVYC
jgi:hypothetical protein